MCGLNEGQGYVRRITFPIRKFLLFSKDLPWCGSESVNHEPSVVRESHGGLTVNKITNWTPIVVTVRLAVVRLDHLEDLGCAAGPSWHLTSMPSTAFWIKCVACLVWPQNRQLCVSVWNVSNSSHCISSTKLGTTDQTQGERVPVDLAHVSSRETVSRAVLSTSKIWLTRGPWWWRWPVG